MKALKYLITCCLISFFTFLAETKTKAQTVMSATPVTTCTTTFVDPGNTSDYGNSLDVTQTFTPTSAASKLRVSFQSFATEQNFDKLYIYDGANTSANLLGIFSGTASPGTITASNAQGQLTFRFVTDAQNTAAGWSAQITCITLPSSPSNLALTVISQTQVDLSWQDNANNETGFKVERSTNDQTNFTEIGDLGAGVTTYQDNTLSANTVYFYRVRAYNGDGNSDFSDQQTATTLPNPPSAPSNLAATPISSSQITLNWQDNSTNETDFKLERKKSGETNFTEIATIDKNTTTYNDTNLEPSTAYVYRIKAINTGGSSAYSAELATQTQLPPPPQAPSLVAVVALSSTEISLSWQDNSTTEIAFVVERSAGDANNFAVIVTLGANSTFYIDQNLDQTTEYFYRVRAVNEGGNSAYTSVVSTITELGVPLAPTNLVTSALSQTKIQLIWQDNSNTETAYKIERKKSGETNFSTIANDLGSNTTSFTDSIGLTAQTTYIYRVRAVNGTGNSAYTNEASATTWIEVPVTPINFVATPISQAEIKLEWQDIATTETGYLLEVSVGNNGVYEQVTSLSANTTAFTHQNLIPEIEYHYRLMGQNSGGNSVAAEVLVTIPSLPEAPDSLYLVPLSTTKVQLHWKDVSVNEEEFIIERGGIGVDFVEIGRVGANEQSFIDSTVNPLTLYDYRVKARHSAGESFYSNTARIDLAVGLSKAAQQLQNQLRLYPNPGKNRLNLQLNNQYLGKVIINIRSLNGAQIYRHAFEKKQRQWQTSLLLNHLTPGLYMVELKVNDVVVGKKWLKKE